MKEGLVIILVVVIITTTATSTSALHSSGNVENFDVKEVTEFQKRNDPIQVIIHNQW